MRHTALITTVALAAGFIAPAAAGAAQWEYMYSSSPESAQARASQQGSQDLRSPDARDAGDRRGRRRRTCARRTPATRAGRPRLDYRPTPVVEIREIPASGFDWGDAAIGAAVILGDAAASPPACMLLLTGRRRRPRVPGCRAH